MIKNIDRKYLDEQKVYYADILKNAKTGVEAETAWFWLTYLENFNWIKE
jgi:hypothetical protein